MLTDGFEPFVSAATRLKGLCSAAEHAQTSAEPQLPILALHGWLDNAESFRQFAAQLPECRVVAPDLPGHGLSPWKNGDNGYLIWSSTQVLYDLLKEQTGEQGGPVHLVGHSMGGAIGLCLAAAFPERIRSFTLIDSAGPLSTPPADVGRQLRQSVEAEFREARMFADPSDALKVRHTASPNMSEDELSLMVQRSLREVVGGWQWRWDPRLRMPSSLRLTEEQIAGLFNSLTCPVLAIRAQDGLMPDSWFRQRVGHSKNLTVVELPGHHHLHMSPQTLPALAQTFRDFIRSL